VKTLVTSVLLSLFVSVPALADDAKRPQGGPPAGTERTPNPTLQADREKLRADHQALRADREKMHADHLKLKQDREEKREERRAKREEIRDGQPGPQNRPK
jgi:hypothetical protein